MRVSSTNKETIELISASISLNRIRNRTGPYYRRIGFYSISKNNLFPVGQEIVEEDSKFATYAHISELMAKDPNVYFVKSFRKI